MLITSKINKEKKKKSFKNLLGLIKSKIISRNFKKKVRQKSILNKNIYKDFQKNLILLNSFNQKKYNLQIKKKTYSHSQKNRRKKNLKTNKKKTIKSNSFSVKSNQINKNDFRFLKEQKFIYDLRINLKKLNLRRVEKIKQEKVTSYIKNRHYLNYTPEAQKKKIFFLKKKREKKNNKVKKYNLLKFQKRIIMVNFFKNKFFNKRKLKKIIFIWFTIYLYIKVLKAIKIKLIISKHIKVFSSTKVRKYNKKFTKTLNRIKNLPCFVQDFTELDSKKLIIYYGLLKQKIIKKKINGKIKNILKIYFKKLSIKAKLINCCTRMTQKFQILQRKRNQNYYNYKKKKNEKKKNLENLLILIKDQFTNKIFVRKYFNILVNTLLSIEINGASYNFQKSLKIKNPNGREDDFKNEIMDVVDFFFWKKNSNIFSVKKLLTSKYKAVIYNQFINLIYKISYY